MSTRYTKRRGYDKRAVRKWRKGQTGKAREIQLTLNPDEVVRMIRDSLTDFATEMGLKVARVLLEDEVSQRCGERYQRPSERAVIYIDGTAYAGETMVAALGITDDGTKRLLGVRQGATENAAASLREGMEETLTVVRLGVPELLRRTLATTNPIESAFSVAENVTRRVKRWREGE